MKNIQPQSQIIIYKAEDGQTKIDVRFESVVKDFLTTAADGKNYTKIAIRSAYLYLRSMKYREFKSLFGKIHGVLTFIREYDMM